VGAGVSIWAGYGSWGQVIQHLAVTVHAVRPELDTQQIIDNNPNPLHCAKHLGAYLGPGFAEFIQTEFGPNGKKPGQLLFRLCSLPFKHFLTLNFDYSLEEIHGALNRAYHTVTTRNLPDLIKFMRSHDGIDPARCVLHLHGTFADPPEHIALTNDGYARLYPDGTLFRKFVWWLTTSKCLVFLGFGFTDSDFLNAIRQAAWDLRDETDPPHFAIRGIRPNENDEAIRNDLNDSYKIDPVFYELAEGPQNRHAGFATLIEGIATELELPLVVPPAVAVDDVPPAAPPRLDDLRRAERLAEELVQKLDPGGDDVPR
jgi:hypothetical protein